MIKARDNETIVAQCSPKGAGAIGLIRISGDDAFAIVDLIARLQSGKSVIDMATHTIAYGAVINEHAEPIDQVLLMLMRAPKTFTGQDTIEITCHNNQFIIEQMLTMLIKHGARLAQSGEFTRRAFLNGKIDLVQAEAINELIYSSNQYVLKNALGQLKGSLSAVVQDIEKKLLHALALSDASFEFLDEENIEFGSQIKELLTSLCVRLAQLTQQQNQQRHIREGIRIALIGSVNVGKSSLFNALLQEKRSIVSAQAGTTRDSVEKGMYVDGLYWTFIDTAGLRETNEIIEQEGIERSWQEARKADVILLIFDQSCMLSLQEYRLYTELFIAFQTKTVVVANKIDLQVHDQKLPWPPEIMHAVSYTKPETITHLLTRVKHVVKQLLQTDQLPYLLNNRHLSLLQEIEHKLKEVIILLQPPIAYELVSIHLKDALESVTQLTGKSISEQALDAIFKEFCVGK